MGENRKYATTLDLQEVIDDYRFNANVALEYFEKSEVLKGCMPLRTEGFLKKFAASHNFLMEELDRYEQNLRIARKNLRNEIVELNLSPFMIWEKVLTRLFKEFLKDQPRMDTECAATSKILQALREIRLLVERHGGVLGVDTFHYPPIEEHEYFGYLDSMEKQKYHYKNRTRDMKAITEKLCFYEKKDAEKQRILRQREAEMLQKYEDEKYFYEIAPVYSELVRSFEISKGGRTRSPQRLVERPPQQRLSPGPRVIPQIMTDHPSAPLRPPLSIRELCSPLEYPPRKPRPPRPQGLSRADRLPLIAGNNANAGIPRGIAGKRVGIQMVTSSGRRMETTSPATTARARYVPKGKKLPEPVLKIQGRRLEIVNSKMGSSASGPSTVVPTRAEVPIRLGHASSSTVHVPPNRATTEFPSMQTTSVFPDASPDQTLSPPAVESLIPGESQLPTVHIRSTTAGHPVSEVGVPPTAINSPFPTMHSMTSRTDESEIKIEDPETDLRTSCDGIRELDDKQKIKKVVKEENEKTYLDAQSFESSRRSAEEDEKVKNPEVMSASDAFKVVQASGSEAPRVSELSKLPTAPDSKVDNPPEILSEDVKMEDVRLLDDSSTVSDNLPQSTEGLEKSLSQEASDSVDISKSIRNVQTSAQHSDGHISGSEDVMTNPENISGIPDVEQEASLDSSENFIEKSALNSEDCMVSEEKIAGSAHVIDSPELMGFFRAAETSEATESTSPVPENFKNLGTDQGIAQGPLQQKETIDPQIHPEWSRSSEHLAESIQNSEVTSARREHSDPKETPIESQSTKREENVYEAMEDVEEDVPLRSSDSSDSVATKKFDFVRVASDDVGLLEDAMPLIGAIRSPESLEPVGSGSSRNSRSESRESPVNPARRHSHGSFNSEGSSNSKRASETRDSPADSPVSPEDYRRSENIGSPTTAPASPAPDNVTRDVSEFRRFSTSNEEPISGDSPKNSPASFIYPNDLEFQSRESQSPRCSEHEFPAEHFSLEPNIDAIESVATASKQDTLPVENSEDADKGSSEIRDRFEYRSRESSKSRKPSESQESLEDPPASPQTPEEASENILSQELTSLSPSPLNDVTRQSSDSSERGVPEESTKNFPTSSLSPEHEPKAARASKSERSVEAECMEYDQRDFSPASSASSKDNESDERVISLPPTSENLLDDPESDETSMDGSDEVTEAFSESKEQSDSVVSNNSSATPKSSPPSRENTVAASNECSRDSSASWRFSDASEPQELPKDALIVSQSPPKDSKDVQSRNSTPAVVEDSQDATGDYLESVRQESPIDSPASPQDSHGSAAPRGSAEPIDTSEDGESDMDKYGGTEDSTPAEPDGTEKSPYSRNQESFTGRDNVMIRSSGLRAFQNSFRDSSNVVGTSETSEVVTGYSQSPEIISNAGYLPYASENFARTSDFSEEIAENVESQKPLTPDYSSEIPTTTEEDLRISDLTSVEDAPCQVSPVQLSEFSERVQASPESHLHPEERLNYVEAQSPTDQYQSEAALINRRASSQVESSKYPKNETPRGSPEAIPQSLASGCASRVMSTSSSSSSDSTDSTSSSSETRNRRSSESPIQTLNPGDLQSSEKRSKTIAETSSSSSDDDSRNFDHMDVSDAKFNPCTTDYERSTAKDHSTSASNTIKNSGSGFSPKSCTKSKPVHSFLSLDSTQDSPDYSQAPNTSEGVAGPSEPVQAAPEDPVDVLEESRSSYPSPDAVAPNMEIRTPESYHLSDATDQDSPEIGPDYGAVRVPDAPVAVDVFGGDSEGIVHVASSQQIPIHLLVDEDVKNSNLKNPQIEIEDSEEYHDFLINEVNDSGVTPSSSIPQHVVSKDTISGNSEDSEAVNSYPLAQDSDPSASAVRSQSHRRRPLPKSSSSPDDESGSSGDGVEPKRFRSERSGSEEF